MFFFTFINRKFWWPKKRKFKFLNFLLFILKKKRKIRPFFFFKKRQELGRSSKKKFFYLFNKLWLLQKFKRYYQRRKPVYKYIKRNLNNFNFVVHKRNLKLSRLILTFTFNNIFFTIQNNKNKNLTYFSSGLTGFSGPTKKTTFAFEQMLFKICNYLKNRKLNKIHLVILSGNFSYRTKTIVDLLHKFGVYVKILTHKIRLPHNGIRYRKFKRR